MKKQSFFSLLILIFWVILGQSQPTLVFRNANVITMDKANSIVSAMAIKGEQIIAVGSDRHVLAAAGAMAQTVDMQGKTITPGFVCAHNHLFNDAGRTEDDILASQQLMFENGITSFGNMYSDEDLIAHLRSMDKRGLIKIKTSVYLPVIDNCGAILDDWYLNFAPTRIAGEKVRVGGVKLFTDGGTCGLLPAISWKYQHTGTTGDLFFDQTTLNSIVQNLDAQGYQIALHAQGDVATRQSVLALTEILSNGNPRRHRIEHNSYVAQDVLTLYGKYGIIPVVWGYYPTCSIDSYASAFGFDSLHWLEDWRSLIDANPDLPIAWHSDAPHWFLNSILNLHSYVTRAENSEDGISCRPPDWLAEHRINVTEALSFMTTGSAYALDRDREVGSIEPGKFADLVFLSNDPLSIRPDLLGQIQILATMADGEFVHCHKEGGWICDQALIANTRGINRRNASHLKIHPNPVSLHSIISFTNHKAGGVEIKLLDLMGRMVSTIFKGHLAAGYHELEWHEASKGPALAPGTYYCVLQNEVDHLQTIRLVITKT